MKNRYWTGPGKKPSPKNCRHLSMSFMVADLAVSVFCCDCGTRATLHMDEANTFTTDQAQVALNQVRDASIPVLSLQDWEKMWKTRV